MCVQCYKLLGKSVKNLKSNMSPTRLKFQIRILPKKGKMLGKKFKKKKIYLIFHPNHLQSLRSMKHD
jgi:hypothetical protein